MPWVKGTVTVDDAAAPNAASAGTLAREVWDSLIVMVPEYIGPTALAAKVAHYRHAATLANAIAEGMADYVNANTPVGTVQYWFHDEASDIATYSKLEGVPADDAEDVDTVSVTAAGGEVLIETYATDAGNPGVAVVPAGQWSFYVWRYVDNAAGATQLVFKVYTRTTGGTETLLFSVDGADIGDTSVALEVVHYTKTTDTAIDATDRFVVKVYAKTDSVAAKSVSFVHEGTTHASYFTWPLLEPLSSVLPSGTEGQILRHNGTAWAASSNWEMAPSANSIYPKLLASGTGYNLTIAAGASSSGAGGDLLLKPGDGTTTDGAVKLFGSPTVDVLETHATWVAVSQLRPYSAADLQICNSDGHVGMTIGAATEGCIGFYTTPAITIQTVDYDTPGTETLSRTSANVRRVWDALIALGLITGSAYDFGA